METLIYIALFGILIGGAVVSVYSIIEGNGRNQTKTVMQQEGDFMVGKINWALSGARTINAPAVGATDSTLSVTKWDTSTGDPIIIDLNSASMRLKRGSAAADILDNDDVTVDALSFRHVYEGGANPEYVVATFTLSARTPNGSSVTSTFTTTNYVRR